MTDDNTTEPPANTGPGFAAVPIWMKGRLTPLQIATYVALQWYVNRETGYCWPSQTSLAADLHTSVSTVQRALKQLRDMGLVSWEQRHTDKGQTSNRYRVVGVTAPEGWTLTPTGPPPGHSDRPPRLEGPTPLPTVTDEPEPTNQNQGTKDISSIF